MKAYAVAVAAQIIGVLTIGADVAFGQGSSTADVHDHGEHFKQIAVYDMTMGVHSLVIMVSGEDSSLAEDSLAFMVVLTTSADDEGLERAESSVEAAWEAFSEGESEPTVVAAGQSVSPSQSVVYQVDLEDPLVMVQLNIVDDGAYALILEHGADQVPVAVTSPSGVVLVASVEEGGEEEDHDDHEGEDEDHDEHDHGDEEEEEESSPATSKQWFNAVLASVAVSACSLAGLFIVVRGEVAQNIDLSHACIFASGALLTASLLHIVPEAMEGLNSKYDNLHDLGLYTGVAVLAGISFGVMLHAFLETNHNHGSNTSSTPQSSLVVGRAPVAGAIGSAIENGKNPDVTQPSSPTVASDSSHGANLFALMEARKGKALTDVANLEPVCWNLVIGDFVHNFADGVTIGAAFLGCSSTVGWTVTASTILHEVPQEIADFMALIRGGMSRTQAFVYNFLSAISAIFGVIVILALRDSLSNSDVSFILLVGAGTFVFMALVELAPGALEAPRAVAGSKSVLALQARKLCSFVLGAGLIGIALVFDQHCEASGHHDH